jgi:transcription-repair coupling factor (superfamily II helicase)
MYVLSTREQLAELGEELRDRFGPLPVEVENLFNAIRLRLVASEVGFAKVLVGRANVEIEFPPDTDTIFYEAKGFQAIMAEVSKWKRKNVLMKQSGNTLRLVIGPSGGTFPVEEAIQLLQDMATSITKAQPTV